MRERAEAAAARADGERILAEARLNAVKSEYGAFGEEEDFTSMERFDEIERQYRAFRAFFKKEWRKAKGGYERRRSPMFSPPKIRAAGRIRAKRTENRANHEKDAIQKGKIEKKYLVVTRYLRVQWLLGTAAGISSAGEAATCPPGSPSSSLSFWWRCPCSCLRCCLRSRGKARRAFRSTARLRGGKRRNCVGGRRGLRPEGETAEPVPAKGQKTRFDGLTRIDGRREAFGREQFDDDVTLPALCREFRNFAAGCLGLYYEESDIRRFVAGLAVSHIMILQGMSGTAKLRSHTLSASISAIRLRSYPSSPCGKSAPI